MRLTYVDESETSDGEVYLFGALICSVDQAIGIEKRVLSVATRFQDLHGDMVPLGFEIHAVDIFHGKSYWRNVGQGARFDLLESTVDAVLAEEPQFVVTSQGIGPSTRIGPIQYTGLDHSEI